MGDRKLTIDTLSHVTSVPKSPAQHWHRDAGKLFSDDQKVPPHAVVIFMPLVDIGFKQGPTEFLLKSHIPCLKHQEMQIKLPDLDANKRPGGGVWTLDECPWTNFKENRFVAEATTGSAILFDLRILHRGGANRGNKHRPVMYLTYVREWFIDVVNFNNKQSKDFDQFDPVKRKLLSRVDSMNYIKTLESMLEEKGVDVKTLQSKHDYKDHIFQNAI
jgi:ectoine hydroxylase-related dioxygenase (phytanoyl-CoA dioxygenase family)